MSNKNLEDEITFFLSSALKTISKHGIDGIKKINLILSRNEPHVLGDFIINLICTDFRLKKDDIFLVNTRGETIIARRLMIALITEHTKLNGIELARIFNRNKKIIYDEINAIKTLDRNNKLDHQFFEKFDKFNQIVITHTTETEIKQ